MVLNPINQKECMVHIIPLQKKKTTISDFLTKIKLFISSRFIKSFFMEEIKIIKNLSLEKYIYIESDKTLLTYLNWLNNTNIKEQDGASYEH